MKAILLRKWPELLLVASVALIAFVLVDYFFPNWRHRNPIVHLSCFAYRDVNRNGIYDLGDRPYAGLKVTIERPKGGPVQRESNTAGFANFDLSGGNRRADIYLPGQYKVTIHPPPEWNVTSSNSSQTITIQKRSGTAVGLIAVRTIDVVGVAPRLKISGSIAAPLNSPKISLKARGPSGAESVITVSRDGDYSFPATPGSWRLEYVRPSGNSVLRNVSVENYPVVVSRIGDDGQSFAPKPKFKIIGFDNLTTSDTLCEIPNGYEGLNWRNWVATHQKLYDGNGYINATTSSEYLAYTSSGHPATISSPAMFDLVGVYVGVAWPQGEQHDVVVKAWRNENQVYQDRFRATTSGPIYFDADYRSITKVEFASDGYWQVVLDDLACRTE